MTGARLLYSVEADLPQLAEVNNVTVPGSPRWSTCSAFVKSEGAHSSR